ncbi:restriction endonuclease [Pseudomonas kilonensis]|uniref:Restriction endonuclease n=1 Tax=Pseudomonas kilonensis TaxID=132476 RepID=A0ABY0ZCL3_9PSED|nr:restriction endonuclease [Pseudomonas kilonensis]SEE52535.1 Restriction endonuclease [Pseudomonas kilonensis]
MSSNKYDLHQLGWSDFQQLCIKVATQVLGQTVESFLEGNDGGRDGAFQGEWVPKTGELLAGRYVIQCKFTARRDHKLSLSDVADEIAKVRKLVKRGACDVYVLMTNAGVTGASSLKIEEAFEDAGVGHVLIFDTTWICQRIEENSSLRMNCCR